MSLSCIKTKDGLESLSTCGLWGGGNTKVFRSLISCLKQPLPFTFRVIHGSKSNVSEAVLQDGNGYEGKGGYFTQKLLKKVVFCLPSMNTTAKCVL